jgi:hypothetical protein
MKFASSLAGSTVARHVKPFEDALLNSPLARGSKIHENLRLGKHGNAGYGIFANASIGRGEVLLCIPKSVWHGYSAESSDKELEEKSAAFHRAVSALATRLVPSHPTEAKSLSNVVAMAIKLMKSRGENDAYVNFLREASFPNDKLCTPHPLLLDSNIGGSASTIDRYFSGTKTHRAIILRQKLYASLSDSLFGSGSDLITSEFHWAVSAILSRGLSGSNFPFTMVPLLDFVNHSSRLENALHIFNEDESFSLIALGPLAPGQEVLMFSLLCDFTKAIKNALFYFLIRSFRC